MRMKKFAFRVFLIVLCLAMIFGTMPVSAIGIYNETDDVPYDTFTMWDKASTTTPVRARGMYDLYKTLDVDELGAGDFSSMSDVCYGQNDYLYIMDGDASRISVFDRDYHYSHSFSVITNPTDSSETYTFEGAKGFVVAASGLIYICDTNNARVLVCDSYGVLSSVLYLPDSSLIPENFKYQPIKIAVDSSNYIYVLSDGSYYGAILYSPKGDFLGFFGANTVATGIIQALAKLWDSIVMTASRKESAERKLPFQFTDLYADNTDFIYTSTGLTNAATQQGQIKRLSPGGLNIMRSDDVPFGLRSSIAARPNYLRTNLVGLAVNDRNFVFTYDASTGIIFIYDDDCKLLNAFGGGSVGDGNQMGNFVAIQAIDVNSEDDLAVIDSSKKTLTLFKINEFGKLVFSASTHTRSGDYDFAQSLWQQVLQLDRNSQVAYSGIARTYFASGDYEKAMEYAQDGFDYDTYSSAFEYVRRGYLGKNLNWIFIVLIIVVAFLVWLHYFKKRKGIVFFKNREVKMLFRVMLHPSDVFSDVKQKGYGSVGIGFLLIIVYYITATLKETESGFIFRSPSLTGFQSLLVLVQTLGFVLLWTVCNWAVCTLLDGKGKMREIFIVTSYSLIPLIISNLVYIVASNVLLESESSFLSIFVTVMQLFMAFILISGTILIHDYSFGKFVGTTILSLLGILIVIFLLVAVVILIQQAVTFFGTVYREFVYR